MCILSGEWAIISRFSELIGGSFLFKSLKFRIFLLVMLVGMIPMFIVRGIILAEYEKNAVAARTSEAVNNFHILADYLDSSGYIYDPSSDAVSREIDQLSNLYDGRVLVINGDYRIVRDSYGISDDKTIISQEVIKCFRGGEATKYYGRDHFILVSVPILSLADEERDETQGVILALVSTEGIKDTLAHVSRNSSVILVSVGIIVFALAIFLANLMILPFSKITSAISSMEAGYDKKPIDVKSYAEMDSILGALNQLLERMRTLDESRQEFVSNVSHELKTPLASMKILADSLVMQPDAPVEMYREFMEDITHEIDRENDIISDLLSLVKMDQKEGTLNIKLVNINELLEMILKRLRPLAEQNNIELVFESIRQVEAEIDEVKLTLAFSNLIENGIKYNRKDGSVRVVLDADHKFMSLEVSDTGIGIPQEHIANIFERFYRVDKSHSREIGGSGLGLAITRSAILMHRGSVKASSVEGEGTTFTVRIPLTYV